MDRPTNIHLLILSLCIRATSLNSPVEKKSIVGGSPSELYPFYVYVSVRSFMCGGSIVAPNAVVTAAHCLFDQSWLEFNYFLTTLVETARTFCMFCKVATNFYYAFLNFLWELSSENVFLLCFIYQADWKKHPKFGDIFADFIRKQFYF